MNALVRDADLGVDIDTNSMNRISLMWMPFCFPPDSDVARTRILEAMAIAEGRDEQEVQHLCEQPRQSHTEFPDRQAFSPVPRPFISAGRQQERGREWV